MAETSLTWRKKQASRSRKPRFSKRMNTKRLTLRHIIIKLSKAKDKEKILKAAREKQLVIYKRTHTKLSDYFSRNFAGQKGLGYVFKLLKEKNLPTKNNLPSKVVLQN